MGDQTADLPIGKLAAPIRQIRLRVIDGPDKDAIFSAERDRVVVGTHLSTDFVLKDTAVSRFHCELRAEEGKAILRDLDSKNGTMLEGVRVFSAPLKDGDTITVGNTRLRFELSPDRVQMVLSERERFGRMVGRSRAMRATFAVLERAAQSDVTVLLLGETGTGKDLAAESIHLESARK